MLSLIIAIVLVGVSCMLAQTLIPDPSTARIVQIIVAAVVLMSWAGHGAMTGWLHR